VAGLNDLLGMLPIKDLASKLGLDKGAAGTAAAHLVPALVGGMQANSKSAGGAAALLGALEGHSADLVKSADVNKINTAEGSKIAAHVFGSNEDAVVQQVAQQSGVPVETIMKMLPALAPLVLSYIKGQMSGGATQATPQATTPAAPAPSGGGIDIGSILGSMLGSSGGATQVQAPQQSSGGLGGLGNILGGMFGGGSKVQSSGGGIDVGSILGGLGGLLGGGTQ
jgi:hypothetical protein